MLILSLYSCRWARVRGKTSVSPKREWMATLEEFFSIFHEHAE